MQDILNAEAERLGEFPPAYAGRWSDDVATKTKQQAEAETEPVTSDMQHVGDVEITIPGSEQREVRQKPQADFIPSQGPIQEDGSRKAKFAAAPFDPSTLPTRSLRQGADAYLDTKWRVLWFRERFPDGQIVSHPITVTDQFAFFSATIYWEAADGSMRSCVAHGSETPGDFRDYIEKAETKAIGRALALAGFGAQFLPEDAQVVDAPVASRRAPQSNATPRNGSTPQKPAQDAQRAQISALNQTLLQQIRRIGASPSRMQAISEEVTGTKSARNLSAAQLKDLIDSIKDVEDNAFDPDEVYVPGSA
jgi:hypothetical protein